MSASSIKIKCGKEEIKKVGYVSLRYNYHEDYCLLGCSTLIALMMEAASTSETSVNF
jgi:hypothetical protein